MPGKAKKGEKHRKGTLTDDRGVGYRQLTFYSLFTHWVCSALQNCGNIEPREKGCDNMIDFNAKKGFICDMDGVIYHGNRILPGVVEFIDWLQANDKGYETKKDD